MLLAQRVVERVAAGDPAIVTGDFNCGEGDPAMLALTREGELLRDTLRVVHPDERSVGTFNGFGQKLHHVKIDAVLATAQWQVQEAQIVRTTEGDRYPSDHFPVTATVALNALPPQP